jgi:Flp pilus assembly pilin Flp
MANLFNRKRGKKGQTMTEYIIIVALVAIASIAIVTIFSNQIRELFFKSSKQLSGDTSAAVTDKGQGADGAVDQSLNDWGKN